MARSFNEKRYPKEYAAWNNMKQRCAGNGPENNKINYAERGITVCTEWRNNFNQFLSDVGKAPSPESSLDRIDNDKGYYKENVRWANAIQQANNRRPADITKRERNADGTFRGN